VPFVNFSLGGIPWYIKNGTGKKKIGWDIDWSVIVHPKGFTVRLQLTIGALVPGNLVPVIDTCQGSPVLAEKY